MFHRPNTQRIVTRDQRSIQANSIRRPPSPTEETDASVQKAIEESLKESAKQKQKLESNEYKKLQDLFGQLYALPNLPSLQKDIGQVILPTAFATLDEKKDISSDVINTFMEILTRTRKNVMLPPMFLDTYFGTYLFNWVTSVDDKVEDREKLEYLESQLERYTDKIDWDSDNLVFIPIHAQVMEHWLLAVLHPRLRHFEIWDSASHLLGTQNYENWSYLLSHWVQAFAPASGKPRPSFHLETENHDHQSSGNDCGAFVCIYALLRSNGMSSTDILTDGRCNLKGMRLFRKYLKIALRPFVTQPVHQ